LNLDVVLMKFLSSFPHLNVCLALSFSKGISMNKCKKSLLMCHIWWYIKGNEWWLWNLTLHSQHSSMGNESLIVVYNWICTLELCMSSVGTISNEYFLSLKEGSIWRICVE
jgi:hypothetical protein